MVKYRVMLVRKSKKIASTGNGSEKYFRQIKNYLTGENENERNWEGNFMDI